MGDHIQVTHYTKSSSSKVCLSHYKKEIQSFKKAGGTITRLPDQLNGRTPDVSTRSRYGWSTDSMMGFGFELDLMEQLIEFSESADEI